MKMECDTVLYTIQAKNQWIVTAFPLYNRRHFDLWPCSGWSFKLRCSSTRVFSQITLSTQPRINVGFKHLCLVLNRTLCMFHNFTRDDHPKLALFCFGSGSTWLNRPAFRGPSAAPGVLISRSDKTGGKECNRYVTEAIRVTLICLLSLDDWNWYDVSDRKDQKPKRWLNLHHGETALWSHRSRNYTKSSLYV